MSTVTIEGHTCYYEVAGDGPPVILVHGALVDCRLWDSSFEPFTAQHRTVRYDVRGFGRSSNGPGPFSVLRDLAGLMDHLRIESAALVGLSMGGVIALEFALAYRSRVSSLVLVGSGFLGYEWSPEMDQWRRDEERLLDAGDIDGAVEAALRFWTDGPRRSPADVDPSVRERVRAMSSAIYRNPPDEKDEERPLIPSGERLEEVGIPTLLVTGAEDVPDVWHAAKIMTKRMPDASQVVIEGGAHHLPMEQPGEFNRVVLSFLATS